MLAVDEEEEPAAVGAEEEESVTASFLGEATGEGEASAALASGVVLAEPASVVVVVVEGLELAAAPLSAAGVVVVPGADVVVLAVVSVVVDLEVLAPEDLVVVLDFLVVEDEGEDEPALLSLEPPPAFMGPL